MGTGSREFSRSVCFTRNTVLSGFQVKLLTINGFSEHSASEYLNTSTGDASMGHRKIVNAVGVFRKLLFSLFSVKLYKISFSKMPENSPYRIYITGCLWSG